MKKIYIDKIDKEWQKKYKPKCCICKQTKGIMYWMNINNYLICFCTKDFNRLKKIIKEAK